MRNQNGEVHTTLPGLPERQLPYQIVVERVCKAVRTHVPINATVAVVSRGDEDLLRFGARRGWHFPRTQNGAYAGYYPDTDEDAVAHLEDLRRVGAGYLVFPSSSFWWFDHYPQFTAHLKRCCSELAVDEEAFVLFVLTRSTNDFSSPGAPRDPIEVGIHQQINELIDVLVPETRGVLMVSEDPSFAQKVAHRDISHLATTASPLEGEDLLGERDGEVMSRILDEVERGVSFLVVPVFLQWWLDRHELVRSQLGPHLIIHQSNVCRIYDLRNFMAEHGDEYEGEPR